MRADVKTNFSAFQTSTKFPSWPIFPARGSFAKRKPGRKNRCGAGCVTGDSAAANSGLAFGQFQAMVWDMTLTLPDNLEARLSPQATALHLAVGLFVAEEATLGQAAQVAGLSQAEFLRTLGLRRIPIHYGREELVADLQAVEALAAR